MKKYLSKCNHPTHSIVAAIFIKGKPISFGWNDIEKTHPIMSNLNEHKKLHAELCAINRCKHKHDLSKATLVVYGENTHGQCTSKPCQYCQEIIKSFGIKKVVFSTYEGFKTFIL